MVVHTDTFSRKTLFHEGTHGGQEEPRTIYHDNAPSKSAVVCARPIVAAGLKAMRITIGCALLMPPWMPVEQKKYSKERQLIWLPKSAFYFKLRSRGGVRGERRTNDGHERIS